jgi:hypothetical protein
VRARSLVTRAAQNRTRSHPTAWVFCPREEPAPADTEHVRRSEVERLAHAVDVGDELVERLRRS